MLSELEILFERMVLIRLFETANLDLFSRGLISGTTHACIGQEANAVGVLHHARPGDCVFSGHRCHGHYLAFTDDLEGLTGELTGRSWGTCGGIGGSQHLCKDGFFSNGILGGSTPVAVGAALAGKLSKRSAGAGDQGISIMFLGDGAMGEGIVYESLNIAALWSVPILFVIENNFYAQTTPIALNTAGTLIDRARAFSIETSEYRTNDVEEVAQIARDAVARVRAGKPYVLILETYRQCGHSKGDDFRAAEELEQWKARDPIALAQAKLAPATAAAIFRRCRERVAAAMDRALADAGSDVRAGELAGLAA